MARSIAQITLMGYVGYKNELKYVGDNSLAVLELSIANSRKEKGISVTDWYKITVFGKVATNVDPFLYKGDLVLVIGQPVFNEYNGKTTIMIRAQSLEVISHKDDNTKTAEPNNAEPNNAEPNNAEPNNADVPF